jgi:hypothetical protein
MGRAEPSVGGYGRPEHGDYRLRDDPRDGAPAFLSGEPYLVVPEPQIRALARAHQGAGHGEADPPQPRPEPRQPRVRVSPAHRVASPALMISRILGYATSRVVVRRRRGAGGHEPRRGCGVTA